jgi:hypothetical protein
MPSKLTPPEPTAFGLRFASLVAISIARPEIPTGESIASWPAGGPPTLDVNGEFCWTDYAVE